MVQTLGCVLTGITQSTLTLGGVFGILWYLLRPVHHKLDALNGVDVKLEKALNGHGHKGLEGDDNQVVIRNP